MTRRLQRALTTRREAMRRGEEGSIILVMLMLTVLMIIAATVTTSAIGSLDSGTTTTARNTSLQGATAGAQAAFASIRAANDGSGDLVTSKLPCSSIAGTTNSTPATTFTASIKYYEEDALGNYTALTCTSGSGPTGIGSGQHLARAVVVACSPSTACPTGFGSASGSNWRRLVSTYTFQTTDQNFPGGLIYSYDNRECLYANYVNATNVTLGATTSCAPGNSSWSLEQFQYTTNWNLQIELNAQSYCVENPEELSSPATSPVPLSTCSSNAVDQWGVNDMANLQGVSTSSSPAGGPDSYCLQNPLTNDSSIPNGTTATGAVTVGSCGGSFNNTNTWQLSAAAGAGGAAPPTADDASTQLTGATDQLVNYQEFGRCIDVTNQNVNSTFLIDYTCKQFPDTADYPTWNQRWCFDQLSTDGNGNGIGSLYTPEGSTSCSGGTDYCLLSPQTTYTQSPTAYVLVQQCTPGTVGNASLWTVYLSDSSAIHAYAITDHWGSCLEANVNNQQPPAGSSDDWSTIQVDTCNGTAMQKWNAPPTYVDSQVANTHEGTGTGAVTSP